MRRSHYTLCKVTCISNLVNAGPVRAVDIASRHQVALTFIAKQLAAAASDGTPANEGALLEASGDTPENACRAGKPRTFTRLSASSDFYPEGTADRLVLAAGCERQGASRVPDSARRGSMPAPDRKPLGTSLVGFGRAAISAVVGKCGDVASAPFGLALSMGF